MESELIITLIFTMLMDHNKEKITGFLGKQEVNSQWIFSSYKYKNIFLHNSKLKPKFSDSHFGSLLTLKIFFFSRYFKINRILIIIIMYFSNLKGLAPNQPRNALTCSKI